MEILRARTSRKKWFAVLEIKSKIIEIYINSGSQKMVIKSRSAPHLIEGSFHKRLYE